jgi:hypothetical protein
MYGVNLPTAYAPDEMASKTAISDAVSIWNGAQSYIVFAAVNASPDTTTGGLLEP